MKILSLAGIFFTTIFSFSAQSETILRIGYSGDYPPLNYIEKNQPAGIDIKLLQELGERMNRPIKFIQTPFNELFHSLDTGQIDLAASGISITTERADKVAFTNPYMIIGQMPIIRYADAAKFGAKDAIYKSAAKVGVIDGTTGQSLAQQQLPNAKTTSYENQNKVIKALRNKDIDFFIHDAPTGWELSSNVETHDLLSTFVSLNREQLAFSAQKNNTALVDTINFHLDNMSNENAIDRVIKQWLPMQVEID